MIADVKTRAIVCIALLVAGVSLVSVAPAGAGPAPPSTRCEFTDVDPQNGQPCIAIGKFSSPGGLVADFTSDIPAPGAGAFQLVGEEAPGALPFDPAAVIKFTNVMAGTYTVTELPIPGVNSAPIACDGQFDAGSVIFGDNSVTFTVQQGEHVTCDFVNTHHELRIVKDADPADGTDFGFTGDLGDFTLDDADPDDGDAVGPDAVFPAALDTPVTVSELVPAGWELTDITCDEGPIRDPDGFDQTDVTVDLASQSITATFGDLFARQVSCTFTNSQLQPGLTLTKTVGTEQNVCGTESAITVDPGTTVYYCYTATNNGATVLVTHDLVDDQLGDLVTGLAFDLGPGDSTSVFADAVIDADVTNVATWTATDGAGAPVSASDDATVTVSTPTATPSPTPTPTEGVQPIAFTGSTTTPLLIVALGLIGLGLLALDTSRRRAH